ncbi:DNA/RNA polymerase [Trametopsis cervina]|nr:DNA/RNA polymerase [Trametopsis cervina]
MSSTKPPSSLFKGKSKATASEADFDPSDLNPLITYRHLHSYNLGVKDPLRVIALCDSDAFYAACEQVRLQLDPAIPLVVLQWDSLIAVNYPARKFGISRMCKVKDALKMCPELKVVHVATYKEGEAEPGYWDNPDTLTHKVSLDFYRRESWKIYHMFKDGLSTGEIEKASIDEAFIDFTRPVRDELMRRYPYLASVPPDAPDGKDSPLPPPPPISWDSLGTVIPVNPPPAVQATEVREQDDRDDGEPEDASELSLEHDGEDVPMPDTVSDGAIEEEDGSTTWHDVALSIAAELMGQIRRDIFTKLGYSTSAGIARNKFLAKLTASYRKPNGQSILRNVAIPNYLKPMPFQKIRFLGGKLGVALAQEYDVSLVSDLLTVNLDEMQRKFGEESIWVWEILRGIDRTEVKERPPLTKSMLASKNLPHPIVKASQGHHWIRVLAAELALRLREARESMPALWPKSLVLHVRQGYEVTRSKQAPFPFVREITVDGIAHAGDKLWKELVGTDASRKTGIKITNVSLSFSGIGNGEAGQKQIDGFFGGAGGVKRKRDDDDVVEEVLAEAGPSRYGGEEVIDLEAEDVSSSADVAGREEADERFTYTCSRCRYSVTLDGAAHRDGSLPGGDENEAVQAIERIRHEHEDFHFAQDLQNEGAADGSGSGKIRPGDSNSGTKGNSSPRKGVATKKRKKAEGKPTAKIKEPKGSIAKFFVQK